jgi:branched-chain amino acid transport system permease protein
MSLDVLAAGVLAGGLYALVGLGISLVFGVLKLMNLAHGEFVMAGAYIASVLVIDAGVDPLVALPFAMVAVAIIAYPLQRYLLTPLLRGGPEAPLVATFGVSLLAQAIFQAVWSSHPKNLPAGYATSGFNIFDIRVQTIYVITFALAVVLCLATHLILTRTRAGGAVRAAAADPATAGILGMNVERIYACTMAGAAALAAAGGVMIGVSQSFTPTSGLPLLLTGFAVMALAGIGSVSGVFVAGIALGVIQSVSVSVFGGGWRDVVVYLVFFLALAIRPQGLFRKVAPA